MRRDNLDQFQKLVSTSYIADLAAVVRSTVVYWGRGQRSQVFDAVNARFGRYRSILNEPAAKNSS